MSLSPPSWPKRYSRLGIAELFERLFVEPEVGFEPTTFRLRGDRKSESPSRLGKVAQVNECVWQS